MPLLGQNHRCLDGNHLIVVGEVRYQELGLDGQLLHAQKEQRDTHHIVVAVAERTPAGTQCLVSPPATHRTQCRNSHLAVAVEHAGAHIVVWSTVGALPTADRSAPHPRTRRR